MNGMVQGQKLGTATGGMDGDLEIMDGCWGNGQAVARVDGGAWEGGWRVWTPGGLAEGLGKPLAPVRQLDRDVTVGPGEKDA